ncbi:MAG: EAL domain-containing protein [Desulfuromonas sp.]|nr:EAL domain-containing protein [Desulfuromonas sp.]
MSLFHLKWILGTLTVLLLLGAVVLTGSRPRGSLRRLFMKWNLLFIIGMASLFLFSNVQTYQHHYQKRTLQLEQELLVQAQQQIKQRATFIHNWILHENSGAEEDLKLNLKTISAQSIATASHLVDRYQDSLSETQLTQLVIEALRPLRFNNGRGYLFATRLDGTALLFADRPQLEGQNLLDQKDSDGVYYVQEMISLCRQQGEGFVSYRISKPGSDSCDHRKIAHVRYFPPLDCYIGTGEYLDNFEQDIQQKIFDKLDHLATDHSLSIFAASYAGVSLFGPGKGKNVLHVQDQNGIFVVKELIRTARGGGGYVRYQMPNELTQNGYEKISYCLPLKGWNSYIGAGINLDHVAQNIALSRADLQQSIRRQILQSAAIIPFIVLFLWYVRRRFSATIENSVNILKDSLHAAVSNSQHVDLNRINFDEFLTIGRETNNMLDQRRQAEQKLEWIAHNDPLTGLTNRHYAVESLKALQRQLHSGSSLWLFMFDLNRFKHINNAYGHKAGDHVLKTMARRLLTLKPTPLLTARLSSNEFIFAVNLSNTTTAEQIATTLRQEIRQPISYKEFSLQLDCSISGIPFAQNDINELLHKADIAIRLVKPDRTYNNFLLYDEQLDQKIRKMEQLEKALRHALLHPEQFELHFQPIWNLETQTLKGFEALVRWHHPNLGMVSPGEFIPLAEQKGMIVTLGKIIFDRACETLARWLQLHPQLANEALRLSVNMAPQQFVTDQFTEEVQSALERYAIPPDMLCIEITETSLMENPELAIQRIQSLKKMGITIAIDDFGTGYSSLSYLSQFEVDTIKIDRSLVNTIDQEHTVKRIAAAIINLSHDLNLQVVAEGIETQEQLQQLRQLNCNAVQGFLIARPLRQQDAEKLLAQRTLPWSEIK